MIPLILSAALFTLQPVSLPANPTLDRNDFLQGVANDIVCQKSYEILASMVSYVARSVPAPYHKDYVEEANYLSLKQAEFRGRVDGHQDRAYTYGISKVEYLNTVALFTSTIEAAAVKAYQDTKAADLPGLIQDADQTCAR